MIIISQKLEVVSQPPVNGMGLLLTLLALKVAMAPPAGVN